MQQIKLGNSDNHTGDVAVSRGGGFALASTSNGIWKVRLTGKAKPLGVNRVAAGTPVIHPNGKFAYALSRFNLYVLNVSGKRPKVVRTMNVIRFAGELGLNMAIAPGGKALYVKYLGGIRSLSLRNPRKPKPIGRIKQSLERNGGMQVAKGGKRLISVVDYGSRQVIYSYNVAKPKRIRVARKRNVGFPLNDVVIAPGGAYAYTAGSSIHAAAHFAKVRAKDLKVMRIRRGGFKTRNVNREIAIAPNGKRVYGLQTYSPSEGFLDLFSTAPFKRRGQYMGARWVNGMAVSHRGSTKGRIYVVGENANGKRVFMTIRVR